ncbi:hypothetical protein, partial [Herbaspirillum sp. 3C11]|uniref:hypothetical protein n=1 Tax=Herbaspirillum sp. 3C11 TaxID=2559615 RepID=UPI001ADD2387
ISISSEMNVKILRGCDKTIYMTGEGIWDQQRDSIPNEGASSCDKRLGDVLVIPGSAPDHGMGGMGGMGSVCGIVGWRRNSGGSALGPGHA